MMDIAGIIHTGEFKLNGSIQQLPDIACDMAYLKAPNGNANPVYVGGPTVTVANGETDTTTGIPLAKNEATPWIPVKNLSHLYVIGTADEDIMYFVVG